MVAALERMRMPGMTDEERDLRSLVRGRLALWGDIQRHGPPAALRLGRSGGGFESRLPTPHWCTDLTIAFAALNPATTGLAARGDTAWLVHAPFSDEQRAIWAYYVADDTPVTAPDPPQRIQWAHEEERATKRALYEHRSARVVAVAAVLHLTTSRTERLLTAAIGKIARSVNWQEEN